MVNPKILLACVAILAAVSAQPALSAAPQKFDTTVTLKVDMTPGRSAAPRGTFAWHGKVKSEKDECENKRFVGLWTIPEGGGSPVLRGKDLTGPDGKWLIPVEANYDGEYYAEAAKRTLGSGKICKLGRSESYIRDIMP